MNWRCGQISNFNTKRAAHFCLALAHSSPRKRFLAIVAARAYDPSIGIFENKALIDIARVEIAETERLIRQLLHDQSIAWPQDAAETTTEHGDMNMSEPVQGG